MKKGGYQIVDFGGNNITADGVTIPGIHEIIEGNYNKPTLAAGLVIDGKECADTYVFFNSVGAGYSGRVYGLGDINITDADRVTFAAG